MKNKAIIFDLDGTAVNSPQEKVASQRTHSAVTALKADYYMCAATGRPWSYAKPVIQHLELDDPCIVSGGTQICDPKSGEILWQKNIDPKAVSEVLAIFKEFAEYKVIFNDYTEDDYLHGGNDVSTLELPEEVYFLEQIFVKNEDADTLEQKLQTVEGISCIVVNAQRPGYKDFHITNSKATKEHAIEVLLKMISVPKENSIGIGDGGNDIHLFRSVGTKIAMGNAVDALKNNADEVIGSIEEDGLAVYFEDIKKE